MKYRYIYSGPVMVFDKLVTDSFIGETVAISAKKALSNMSFRFKEQCNLSPNTRVKLFEKYLKKMEAVDDSLAKDVPSNTNQRVLEDAT